MVMQLLSWHKPLSHKPPGLYSWMSMSFLSLSHWFAVNKFLNFDHIRHFILRNLYFLYLQTTCSPYLPCCQHSSYPMHSTSRFHFLCPNLMPQIPLTFGVDATWWITSASVTTYPNKFSGVLSTFSV